MFRKLFSRRVPETPAGATDSTPQPSVTSNKPNWVERLDLWAIEQLAENEIAPYVSTSYKTDVIAAVIRMRAYFLSDSEFTDLCRATSQALMFRAQIIIVGIARQAITEDILESAIAVLTEYPSIYTTEDVLTGRISLKIFGKLQIFESELYALVQSYLTQDVSWFSVSIREMELAADKYWTELENTSGLG